MNPTPASTYRNTWTLPHEGRLYAVRGLDYSRVSYEAAKEAIAACAGTERSIADVECGGVTVELVVTDLGLRGSVLDNLPPATGYDAGKVTAVWANALARPQFEVKAERPLSLADLDRAAEKLADAGTKGPYIALLGADDLARLRAEQAAEDGDAPIDRPFPPGPGWAAASAQMAEAAARAEARRRIEQERQMNDPVDWGGKAAKHAQRMAAEHLDEVIKAKVAPKPVDLIPPLPSPYADLHAYDGWLIALGAWMERNDDPRKLMTCQLEALADAATALMQTTRAQHAALEAYHAAHADVADLA